MVHYLDEGITKKEFLKRVGDISQVASINPYEMREGKAKGLRALDVVTGSGLEFTVLGSKCLDIYNARFKGINLNFASKSGLVSPEFFNPHEGETLRSFQGGLLYTCGLSNVGPGCIDNGTEHCMHGRIGNTPAVKESLSAFWKDDEYIMQISGEMCEAALFKENLVLRRTLTSKLGGKSIYIHNEVENQGFEACALMILFHFNLGYPVLDKGSRFILPSIEVVPRDEDARKGLGDCYSFSEPIESFREQVFYHTVAADTEGNTCAGLVNERLKLGVFIKYNAFQLPKLVQWKSMRAGDYVLGIEPGNCLVEGRNKERERGTLKHIGPFEKLAFDLEFGILDGAKEIDDFANMVSAFNG